MTHNFTQTEEHIKATASANRARVIYAQELALNEINDSRELDRCTLSMLVEGMDMRLSGDPLWHAIKRKVNNEKM